MIFHSNFFVKWHWCKNKVKCTISRIFSKFDSRHTWYLKSNFFFIVQVKSLKKIADLTNALDPVRTVSSSAAVVAFLSKPLPPKTFTISEILGVFQGIDEFCPVPKFPQYSQKMSSPSQNFPWTSRRIHPNPMEILC